MNDLILYNKYHNGDIFYSRILIKMLYNNFKIKFYHNNKPKLFQDIETVEEYHDIAQLEKYSNTPYSTTPKINTWIRSYNDVFYQKNNAGCSFENHFSLASSIVENLNIKINPNPEEYLPFINFDKLINYEKIYHTMITLKSLFDKLVLVCNGKVCSGQSDNFDFNLLLPEIATSKNNILFLVTESFSKENKNIFDVKNITNTTPDLLQIGFISTFCDVLIGRASGPICYTHIKENLLNPEKTYISFSNSRHEGEFYQNQKSKSIWSNNYDLNTIKQTIIENI